MSGSLVTENVRETSAASLQASLVDLVELERQLKQAHWNIKGPDFIALHELLDRLALEVRDLGDTLAERLVTIGSEADGTVQTVSGATRLPPWPSGSSEQRLVLSRIADAIGAVAGRAAKGIDETASAGDAVTADIFTEAARALDKQRWLVEAHLT